MSYCAVNVSEIGDSEYPFELVSTDDNGYIIPEMWDGGLGTPIIANRLNISVKKNGENNYQQVLRAGDISMEVFITFSRIIMRCEKYDKGSTFAGGLTAIALTAGARAIAAHRRKGKLLMGHIRYEWINYILYSEKHDWLSSNELRIIYKDNEKNSWYVTVGFKKGTDIVALANDVLHKASRYRLAMTDEQDEEDVKFFTKYTTALITPSADPEKEYSNVRFPSYYSAPAGGKKFRPQLRAQ